MLLYVYKKTETTNKNLTEKGVITEYQDVGNFYSVYS